MKKFFQKYKNYIMAVISALLMLAFGLPGLTPGKGGSTGSSAPAGYLNGHKVTVDTTSGYRGELSMLRDFGFLDSQGGASWVDRLWLEQGGAPDEVGVYWFVLCQEASRYMSITVGPDEAVKYATQGGLSESQVTDKLDHTYKVSRSTLAMAVSHLFTVQRYLNFMESFAQPISAMELSADRELRKLTVDYVPIDAAGDWLKVSEEAVKEQLNKQYEAYKDVLRTRIPGPQDPPVFLGVEKDERGDYALLGYPGSVASPAHVHEGEIIAWDGSKADKIYRQGDIIGFNGNSFVRAPATMVVLTGNGRVQGTPIAIGSDIHDNFLPAYPGEINGHHYPFGYKFADRVKVEYLKFSRLSLRGRLEVTAADVEAALKAFQADPYKFRERPAATAPAPSVSVAAPGATVPAASKPVERSPEEILNDWNERAIKQPYLDEQLNLRTTALLKKLVDAARSKADIPWKKPAPPERAEWVDYRALADATSRDTALRKGRISGMKRWFAGVGFGGYVPSLATSGPEFLDAAQLQNIPGIGHAIYTTSQTAVFDFPTLAGNILELVTPDKSKPLGRMSLQMGHECPEVTDSDGNVYLFRVTEFEKSHVPASLDAVRGQVVEDCKKLAAYGRVLEEVKTALKTPDLAALAKQYESHLRSPTEFNRDESAAPADVQSIRGFVKAAFDLPDPKETGKPSVTALENEQSLMIYSLQVTRNFPASGPDFITELNQGFFSRQPDPAVSTFAQKYLSYKEMAGRVKFTLPPGGSWPTRAAPTSAPRP